MSLLTELGPFVDGDAIIMPALTGLEKSVFIGVHPWLKIQPPFARVRPPQTAIGRCLRTATNWDIAGERARPVNFVGDDVRRLISNPGV